MKTTDEVRAILAQDPARELLYIARNLLGHAIDSPELFPRHRAMQIVEQIDRHIRIEELV